MGDVKVRFLPEGGFDKNGAFIEYEGGAPNGREAEYQRASYLGLDIVCTEVKLGMNFEVVCEFGKIEDRKFRRSIFAVGEIQPARWGKFSLSFLGENGSTSKIAISIHENPKGEAATLSGLKIDGDLDIEDHSGFFLELDMHSERFSTLLKELSTVGAVLTIRVRADRFDNFYAEWSPSISEGRIIKFLDEIRDVENADEIPNDFWRTPERKRELLSNSERPPVTISVGRPLQPQLSDTTSASGTKDD